MTALPPGMTSRPPGIPSVLYHYTCRQHGEPGIRDTMMLYPHSHPLLRMTLTWFTDLAYPDRWALGLTNTTLCCDRTQVRVSVAASASMQPWHWFARQQQDRIPPVMRDVLEQDGMPMHWWVSPAPETAFAIAPLASLRPRKVTQ
jgi:hypothetical protein